MTRALRFLYCLRGDDRGVAVVELGLTLPILLLLTVGAYDVSRLITTRLDYQQAAAETASLAMARPPQGNTSDLRNAAASASGLPLNKVVVTQSLLCNGVLSADANCAPGQEQARYVTINLNGSFNPMWVQFGLNGTQNISVTRRVRIQ